MCHQNGCFFDCILMKNPRPQLTSFSESLPSFSTRTSCLNQRRNATNTSMEIIPNSFRETKSHPIGKHLRHENRSKIAAITVHFGWFFRDLWVCSTFQDLAVLRILFYFSRGIWLYLLPLIVGIYTSLLDMILTLTPEIFTNCSDRNTSNNIIRIHTHRTFLKFPIRNQFVAWNYLQNMNLCIDACN